MATAAGRPSHGVECASRALVANNTGRTASAALGARRFSFGMLGGLLSLGAPIGLLGVRYGQHRGRRLSVRALLRELAADPAGYAYVSLSTAMAFTLFGFVLGRQADHFAELSETDGLTGLYNVRGFRERLRTEVARFSRYREPLALLLLDVDGLKRINDRFGHRAGDQALLRVADAIRAGLRAPDAGARWGGDEFAILAPSTPPAAATALAERIRRLIASDSAPWPLSVSIGVATTVDEGVTADPEALMQYADAALYRAKRARAAAAVR